MSLLSSIPFEQIAESHLQQLIVNAVAETHDLEFKQATIGNSDLEKREFLKDVTSFANTLGGHVIIGMAEIDGVAHALVELTERSADDELLRLQSMLLASVEPRLLGIQLRGVPLTAQGYVLVIRIPQSWNPPHRVSHSGVNRFYLRHSNGAYEPSVDQLRAVFVGGQKWNVASRSFG